LRFHIMYLGHKTFFFRFAVAGNLALIFFSFSPPRRWNLPFRAYLFCLLSTFHLPDGLFFGFFRPRSDDRLPAYLVALCLSTVPKNQKTQLAWNLSSWQKRHGALRLLPVIGLIAKFATYFAFAAHGPTGTGSRGCSNSQDESTHSTTNRNNWLITRPD